MPPLPVIGGRQARSAFEKAGWQFARQRGSHMVLSRAGSKANLTIPDHREIDSGLLRGLIRDAGMTVERFLSLLK